MNFIKRAGITLWARKGRTILLMITSSVILVFVMAGLIIQNAALTAAKTATNSIGSTVTLSADREKMFAEMKAQMDATESSTTTTRPTIVQPTTTVAKVKKIAALSNVATYNISNTASVNASGFTAVTTTTSAEQGGFGGMGGGPGGERANQGDISINGVSASSAVTAFTDGTAKITSGRAIKASDAGSNNVIVESELATSNSMKVGQTIKVTDPADTSKKTSLKIVGIYKVKTSTDGFSRQDPSNTIYGSYTLANTLADTVGKVSNVTFMMADPAKTKTFTKAAKTILNSSKLTLTTDESAYKQAASNMKGVASFASKIVWLVAIAGILILGLIILLMTRERRREIGILVSLGESKVKVVGQLFVELLVVLIIALGVATAAGTAVSGAVSETLVAQQQSAQQQTARTGAAGGGMPGQGGGQTGNAPTGGMPGRGGVRGGGAAQAVAETTDIKPVLTPAAVAQLGGVAFLIALLSVSGAGITILRMRPKQIMQAD